MGLKRQEHTAVQCTAEWYKADFLLLLQCTAFTTLLQPCDLAITTLQPFYNLGCYNLAIQPYYNLGCYNLATAILQPWLLQPCYSHTTTLVVTTLLQPYYNLGFCNLATAILQPWLFQPCYSHTTSNSYIPSAREVFDLKVKGA